MRGRGSLPALVMVALLLAGCGSPSPSDSAVPIPSPTPTPSLAASLSAPASPASMAPATPAPEPPSRTATPSSTAIPVVVRPVSPSALPVRDTAYRMGLRIRMAPDGDGGLYVAIPDGHDTLLVALDDKLRVRPGWPLLLEGRTSCAIAADVGDSSVRAVCGDDTPEALGFDRAGRPLDGWPVRLPRVVYPWAEPSEPRVIGGDLYLVSRTYDEARHSVSAWLTSVSRDGTIETGTAVVTKEGTTELGIDLGPDGTGYLSVYGVSGSSPEWTTAVTAFDLDGVRPGWPIEFDPVSVSHPGFGRDGQVGFVQGTSEEPSRLHSVDRQGRTKWTVELPVTASPEWNGASEVVVPAPPAMGSEGTAFVVTELDRGEGTAVYAFDPSGHVSGRWSSPVGLAYAGFCELRTASGGGCATGCGKNRVTPVVGDDGTLYFALEDGRVVAVGTDGRTQAGWPVTLRRPGASFWSLATDADGTVFALAIEFEPGAGDTPDCEYPPASATVLAFAPDGSVRARATVVEP